MAWHMGKTVFELTHNMPSKELSEWYAYFSILAKERKEEELARKAEQGVNEIRKRRRR